MPTLKSLADLQALMDSTPPTPQSTAAPLSQKADTNTRLGYDGKPYKLTARTEKRGNKIVTMITGFQVRPDEITRLVKLLKTRCGAGGNALDNAIELQGDHCKKAGQLLQQEGYGLKS